MKISAPSRTRPGRVADERLHRRLPIRLFSAALAVGACLALACSDDDPAEETGVGGNTGAEPDASVRELPGDGREPTPDFDTESRQRNPIGPRRLVETIDEERDGFGLGGGDGPGDAGSSADAADGGGN